MMRALLLPVLLLTAACQQQQEAAAPPAEGEKLAAVEALWSAGARDRLCLKNDRAGLIVYAGSGDANCSVRGQVSSEGGEYRIKPDGDEACTITARRDGAALVLGEVAPACAYYCGPGASFGGMRLEQKPEQSPAVDLAGDPLC